ncbi:MAG: proline--tRNA ligase [Candidatus Omnitrophica bacterium]|nr:proline--tRNA ligase [Candidatus Omnitrophota bacterium]MCB9746883.1 proline--tRNA ligase [Candidatus Omnitrophota bacterium]
MKWSQFFIPTFKEIPIGTEAVSHQLLLRAGLVHMLTSGVYSYLPLGLRVLRKVEKIIREEMESIGARELFLPCLHPLDIWKQTGRDQDLKDVMIKFEDNRGRQMCLGPTHEEIITNLVKDFVQSYRQLPVTLYQIQTKFRDEIRTRFGIVRACEFIMKDAYSFDRDKAGLQKNYDLMYDAYKKIFKRCELDVVITEAESGAMGGDVSHEFLIPAAIGEDTVTVEVDGKKQEQVAIELGHIFQLGTKYSQALQALFLDEDGKQKPMIMGCYGIGVSRVIAAIIEKHNDEKGIIWPKEIAPFQVEILPLQSGDDQTIAELAQKYLSALEQKGIEVLLDDRNESAGRKFNDADLIGIPYRITIGKKNLVNNQVEIKERATNTVSLVSKDQAVEEILKLLAK